MPRNDISQGTDPRSKVTERRFWRSLRALALNLTFASSKKVTPARAADEDGAHFATDDCWLCAYALCFAAANARDQLERQQRWHSGTAGIK